MSSGRCISGEFRPLFDSDGTRRDSPEDEPRGPDTRCNGAEAFALGGAILAPAASEEVHSVEQLNVSNEAMRKAIR